MPEKELSHLGKKILEKIVNENLKEISYYHPEMQLGKELIKNYAQTIDVLSSFEHEFGITKLEPALKFKRPFLFFRIPTRCGYEIYQDKAKELYNSIKLKNQKEQEN